MEGAYLCLSIVLAILRVSHLPIACWKSDNIPNNVAFLLGLGS